MKKNLLFFLSLFSASLSFGQAGILDPTFGMGGKYSFQKHNYILDVGTKQTDDKIILAGRYYDSTNNDPGNFCMIRLKVDGTLDSTFGTNGTVVLAFTPYSEGAGAVKVQPDGKIILVGSSNYNGNSQITMGAVARFKTNGSIDSSFATNGKRFVDLGGVTENELYSIDLQSNGKIILGGSASNRTAICRLNTDGSTDQSFGVNGVFIGPDSNAFSYLKGMAIQQDDKILALNTIQNPNYVPSVLRITTNGTIDSTFGTNGRTSVPYANTAFPQDIKIQSDNKIVLLVGSDGLSIARLQPNGSLDNTFGSGGKVITNFNPNGISGICLTISPADNKILTGCIFSNSSQSVKDYRILRYTTNGVLDNEFGTNGATDPIDFYGYADYPGGLFILNDGKILLEGTSTGGGFLEPYYSLMRFNSCGINISTQPSNITKTEGSTATFTVGSSSPSASYQWQNKTGNTWINLSNGGQYSGVQTATLSVANLTMSNNLAVFRAVGISGACTDTSNAATLTVETGGTGIQNVFSLNGIKVYPNPAKDLLQIEMNTAQYNSTAFIISDITGKEIKTGLLKNAINNIPVITMAPGVYFLRIDGIGTMKLIKE